MRWRKPAEGAKRKVSKFLLSPMTIGNETRWLEWATWEEIYNPFFNGGEWFPWRWVDKKEVT